MIKILMVSLSALLVPPSSVAQEYDVLVFPKGNLEVHFDDKAIVKIIQKPMEQAVAVVEEIFPPIGSLEPIRVVVLADQDAVREYRTHFAEVCARQNVAPPPPSFFESVAVRGSGMWTFPPLCLIYSRGVSKNTILTRAVHDYGALRISLAASQQAFGVPAFLVEGFAGMLVRRSVKKPVGLVSHVGAVESERVHGYGVFAGIGGALNDSSNHPGNWPTSMKTVTKAWRKQGEVTPEEHIDALVRRPKVSFSRADYAYAWAVTEFLLEDRFPYGEAALAIVEDRKWKPKGALKNSRRSLLPEVLGKLRDKKLRTMDAEKRADLFLELLYARSGETSGQMQDAFLFWLERGMPKK